MTKQILFFLEKKYSRRLISTAAFMTVAATSFSAHATLGGDGASVTADQSALHATMTASVKSNYTDYTFKLPDGIVVHEMVNPAGKVFEVTWNGKGHRPDMEQILGSYFSQFRHEGKRGSTHNRPLHVDTDVVIDSYGSRRTFFGTAYVPALLPAGMNGPVSVSVEVKK